MTGRCFDLAEFAVMSRIRIEDLSHEETLQDDDLRKIFGAGLSERSIQATRSLFADRSTESAGKSDDLIRQPQKPVQNPFLADRDTPLS